jgi:hypothetical protein
MKTIIRTLNSSLVALFLAITVQSVSAAPPQTGIRGQTLLYQSFYVEVSPGQWLGDNWWESYPASFRVLSAHSGREVAHVSSSPSFEVSLPPGKYIVVPDTPPGFVPLYIGLSDPFSSDMPFTGPFEVTVTAKHFADFSIVYVSSLPVSP